MEVAGTQSWRMSEDRWPELMNIALWIRAAERIAVPADGADGVVPGETDIDPVPPPTAAVGEAAEWNAGRLRAGLAAGRAVDMRANQVVRDLERELGRPVRPFELAVVVVPVRDDQIRQLGTARYLVPERVHDGPDWPRLLRELLLPIA